MIQIFEVLSNGDRSPKVCWTYKMINSQNRGAGIVNGRGKRFTQYRIREHTKFEGIRRQKIKYRFLLVDNVVSCSLYFAAHFRNH